MDSSSLSKSPYTSPSMISPPFDLSSSSLSCFSILEHPQNPNPTPSQNPNTLPPVRGFHQPLPRLPPVVPEHKWPPSIDGVHADVVGYAVYGTMPGPPSLAGGGGGMGTGMAQDVQEQNHSHGVVHTDGSAFVSYTMQGNCSGESGSGAVGMSESGTGKDSKDAKGRRK
jgi:hypothetical protein